MTEKKSEEMRMHENWIRYNSFEQASKRSRFASVDKVIEDAQKIQQFIFGKEKASITCITSKR